MHRRLVALGIALAARTAAADPACVPSDAASEAAGLRDRLTRESARAHRWNLAWGIGFGTVSAAQFALAAGKWNPIGPFDRDYKDALYVGAGKAAIGALARVVTPLHVDVPALVADPCADVIALRAALADAAKLERALFWTSHVGGLAVTLGGSAILASEASWSLALVTFAYSYPIGLLSTYTMPRGAWHEWREAHALTIAPVPLAGGGVSLMAAGTF